MTLLTSTESVLPVQEFSPLMTPNCLKEVAKIGSDVCIYVCEYYIYTCFICTIQSSLFLELNSTYFASEIMPRVQ